MNLSKYHNKKAYMFLSQQDHLVKAFVMVLSDNAEDTTYVEYISHEQAEYLVQHRSELESKGIHVTDNRVEATVSPYQQDIVLALPFTKEKVNNSFSYTATVSEYISSFNEILFFSTQKTRAPAF